MEKDKKELRNSKTLDTFTTSATEHIFKKTLKIFMIILWHYAVFVRNKITKNLVHSP